jgi:hypothetical protein
MIDKETWMTDDPTRSVVAMWAEALAGQRIPGGCDR